MTYKEVIHKLFYQQGELRYHDNGTIGSEEINLFWDDMNEGPVRLHHKVFDKICRRYDVKRVPYAIEGSEETGWYKVTAKAAQSSMGPTQ